MSQRNNSFSPFGTAISVGIGVGALAALGYALYEAYQEETTRPMIENVRTTPKCVRCGRELQGEKFQLLCSHKIHKDCLKAHCMDHLIMGNNGPLECPECFSRIPDSLVKSFFPQPSISGPRQITNTEQQLVRSSGGLRCKYCSRDIDFGEPIQLNCSHSFHKNCIASNYIVQRVKGRIFACPITSCKKVVSEDIILSFSTN
uniref:Unkown protein n=1 Tax=Riptortus pedestris TaxID=329032 RepID=R4WNX6_RIPPE|nr:unkown protein [Riptortus pedestris]